MSGFKHFLFRISRLLPENMADKMELLINIMVHHYAFFTPYMHAEKFDIPDLPDPDNVFQRLGTDSIEVAKRYLRGCRYNQILTELQKNGRKLCIQCDDAQLASQLILPPPPSSGLKKMQKKYGIKAGAESLIYQQGIALLPDKVKKYLHGSDFIDAGAYHGHYTLPLFQYFPRKVYAFEPSRKSGNIFRRQMLRNKIAEAHCELFCQALGAENSIIGFDDRGSSDQQLCNKGKSFIQMRRLDDFVAERGLRVGMIKSDVEGMGMQLLRGAIKTIERDRPVLALSCYHTPEEFFGQYSFLESRHLNYHFILTDLPPGSTFEITLLGYPEELSSLHDSPQV